MASPMDSIARKNNYISTDSDWVTFETTVSTLETAIAPGYLQKQWKKAETIFIIRWIKKC
jgi:ABC-2 type transport system permease protein